MQWPQSPARLQGNRLEVGGCVCTMLVEGQERPLRRGASATACGSKEAAAPRTDTTAEAVAYERARPLKRPEELVARCGRAPTRPQSRPRWWYIDPLPRARRRLRRGTGGWRACNESVVGTPGRVVVWASTRGWLASLSAPLATTRSPYGRKAKTHRPRSAVRWHEDRERCASARRLRSTLPRARKRLRRDTGLHTFGVQRQGGEAARCRSDWPKDTVLGLMRRVFTSPRGRKAKAHRPRSPATRCCGTKTRTKTKTKTTIEVAGRKACPALWARDR
jgi:hypothetical protein